MSEVNFRTSTKLDITVRAAPVRTIVLTIDGDEFVLADHDASLLSGVLASLLAAVRTAEEKP